MNKHTARMRAFKGFILFYFDLEKEGPVAIWIWTFLVFFFFWICIGFSVIAF